MERTLVFCFDGTGNEPDDAGRFEEDESISNILKMHILMGGGIEEDCSDTKTHSGREQINHYYNGIGTRKDGQQVPILGWLISKARRKINLFMAPEFGDARRILEEARKDYKGAKQSDKLVVFGFSRGAALARRFVSEILADNPKRTVAFLGVFDTVAAMGDVHRKGEITSSDVVFENGTLNDRVERAVHIVSIDETRITFEPTLINKDARNKDRILEVWFPGVHSDIGGGYWHDGLSDQALQFMISQCRASLGDDINISDGDYESVHDRLAEQRKGNQLMGMVADDIVVHPMPAGPVHFHSGLKATIQGADPRAIHVCINDRPSKNKGDVPLLHLSVKERFHKESGYRPPALRGLRFRLLKDDGSRNAIIEGIAGLRDAKFG